MDDPTPPTREVVYLAILVEGGLIVVAWVVGWFFHTPPLATFQWDWLAALWGVLATLPMVGLFFVCLHVPWRPLQRIRHFVEDVFLPALASCSLLDLAGIALLAGLGEEMLFRGVLQGAFSRWMDNVWLGLVLASILFGLVHAITPTYALFATLLGLYLGWLWLVQGNLLLVVVAHALYDFFALVYLLRNHQHGVPSALPPPPPPAE